MLGGRDFGPADWPGHDAQGEGIEGEKGGNVKIIAATLWVCE